MTCPGLHSGKSSHRWKVWYSSHDSICSWNGSHIWRIVPGSYGKNKPYYLDLWSYLLSINSTHSSLNLIMKFFLRMKFHYQVDTQNMSYIQRKLCHQIHIENRFQLYNYIWYITHDLFVWTMTRLHLNMCNGLTNPKGRNNLCKY